LFETAVKEYGPLFTLEQIKPLANTQKLSTSQLHYFMSTLADAGWIEILKRGTYLVKSPLYSEEVPIYDCCSINSAYGDQPLVSLLASWFYDTESGHGSSNNPNEGDYTRNATWKGA